MTSKKTTRRALLTSMLSLLICVSMLVGSTFAWFTDSVTSANNVIKSGNLDVTLEYWDGDSYEEVTSKTKLFNDEALWEPGYTEVAYLKIGNAGSLALKYQLGVNVVEEITGLTKEGKEIKLSDHLVFKVIESVTDLADAYKDNREAAKAAAGSVKGLKDYNSGTKVLEETGAAAYVALIIYMPESVGNEANHDGKNVPSIEMGVNLFATQKDYESDSFGSDYDKFAGMPWDGESKEDPVTDNDGVIHITNAAQLVAMMDTTGNSIYSGKTIVLDADINLNGHTVKGIGGDSNFAGIFDGQGHTISNFKIDASNRSYYAGLFNQVSHGGTVKNLTVKGATVIGNSMVGAVASSVDSGAVVDNCKAIGCTLIAVKKVGAVVGYSAGSTVTNNYAENCTVYYSEKEGAEVLGFENTGSTVSNNTFNNVTVKHANYVEVKEDITTGDDFTSPNTIIGLGGNTLTMTSSDHKVSGNLTVTDGTVDMTKGYFDIRPSGNSETVFENVVFNNTELKKTSGSSTNHVKSAMETTPLVAGATMKFTFTNCTFNNANVVFEAMSGYPDLTIEAVFENCTFNLFGNASAIEIQNYITADITIKDCTFNLTATSGVGIVDSMSGSTVNVTFEGNNILNGIAAVATDTSVAGTVNEVRTHNPSVKVAATSWAIDTLNGKDTITCQGIATK